MTGVGARNLAQIQARMPATSHRGVPSRGPGLGHAVFALGRLRTGDMNRTEAVYAEHLEARRRGGEVLWWRFEGIKLKLADRTHLTVDFAVMVASGHIEMHDVKGGRGVWTEDAKVKMKVAAAEYPFRFFVCFPRSQRDGGGWDVEAI